MLEVIVVTGGQLRIRLDLAMMATAVSLENYVQLSAIFPETSHTKPNR